MSEVLNLRLARKRKRRDDDARQAAENRVTHSRSMAAKKARQRTDALEAKQHEGHRRTPQRD